MMTEPKQPDDHPASPEAAPQSPEHGPTGNAPNGMPPDADAAEAKGWPTSDRQATETTAHPDKHSDSP